MESLNTGWLYGLIVMLSQTCNPDYKQPSPRSYQDGQVIEIPADAFGTFEDAPMVEEAPPPPPPPPPVNDPSPREAEEEWIFKVVEDMPRFPGCEDMTDRNERKKCAQEKMLKFLYSGMKYPEKARKEGVEGTAIVQFAVDIDGSIKNVKLLRAPSTECGAEAIRVVKTMPKWIPGKQRGKAVKVQYNLPMKFKL